MFETHKSKFLLQFIRRHKKNFQKKSKIRLKRNTKRLTFSSCPHTHPDGSTHSHTHTGPG